MQQSITDKDFYEWLSEYLLVKSEEDAKNIIPLIKHMFDAWRQCNLMHYKMSTAAALRRLSDTSVHDLNIDLLAENLTLKQQLKELGERT